MHYLSYHQGIQSELSKQYHVASHARERGLDPSTLVESPLASDLADRVAKLLEVPIADRLGELLKGQRTELAALTVATEVAEGKYPIPEGQSRAEAAVRIGLAVVTDGVTVAPYKECPQSEPNKTPMDLITSVLNLQGQYGPLVEQSQPLHSLSLIM